MDDEPKNLTVLETVLDDPAYRLVRADSAARSTGRGVCASNPRHSDAGYYRPRIGADDQGDLAGADYLPYCLLQ